MSKITIPTEVWIELYSELAEWHVEKSAHEHPWEEDGEGNKSYTEDAQDQFDYTSDCIEKILENFFQRGS
tara:strand:- start:337 stop:546 length:210 start_codon:yes stop_codon:yes gene_type:complete